MAIVILLLAIIALAVWPEAILIPFGIAAVVVGGPIVLAILPGFAAMFALLCVCYVIKFVKDRIA